ncbi:MAG: hypothetical protein HY814_12640 [Candidatus Riflebacteria bacterium]|nr:hypothetical protein [Candidatus Riflebacteria bacterium]
MFRLLFALAVVLVMAACLTLSGCTEKAEGKGGNELAGDRGGHDDLSLEALNDNSGRRGGDAIGRHAEHPEDGDGLHRDHVAGMHIKRHGDRRDPPGDRAGREPAHSAEVTAAVEPVDAPAGLVKVEPVEAPGVEDVVDPPDAPEVEDAVDPAEAPEDLGGRAARKTFPDYNGGLTGPRAPAAEMVR